MAGFHSNRRARVTPGYWLMKAWQVVPATTRSQRLQVAMTPGWVWPGAGVPVGVGGVLDWEVVREGLVGAGDVLAWEVVEDGLVV